MMGMQRIPSRRNMADGEGAVFGRNGVIGVVKDINPCRHPVMQVADEFDQISFHAIGRNGNCDLSNKWE